MWPWSSPIQIGLVKETNQVNDRSTFQTHLDLADESAGPVWQK